MSYWRCHYHLIWATNQRLPVLGDRQSETFRAVNAAACRDMGVLIHQVGVVSDHVHLVVSIPPRLAVSNVVQRIKGTSSRVLAEQARAMEPTWPGWQLEYGGLTFGERSLDKVAEYVANQKSRHSGGDIWPQFETFDRRDLE